MNGKILVELQEYAGSDAAIANGAWTSTYNKDTREDKYDDPQKVAELVPRLIKEGHSTPIEFVWLRFWIRMPIFTDRQFMTHRMASHSGLSGRYRTMPGDWYSVPEDCCKILDKINYEMGREISTRFDEHCQQANDLYKLWLSELKSAERAQIITNAEYKRVREILRGNLPTAGMVERTSAFNLRSFANFQRLRNSDHAQLEIRTLAQLMLEEVEKANIAPIAIQALKENGWKI